MSEFLYQIERDADDLRMLRVDAAHKLIADLLALGALENAKPGWLHAPCDFLCRLFLRKSLRGLAESYRWKRAIRSRARYDAVCGAVDAIECHHAESHLLKEVEEFARDGLAEERQASRLAQDESIDNSAAPLKFILEELRAIRDVVDPPKPLPYHLGKARQVMRSLQGEAAQE